MSQSYTTTPPQYALWKNKTITAIFEKTVSQWGSREALVDPLNRKDFTSGEPQRFTFDQLHLLANQLATIFHKNGIRKGDAVGVFLPNIHELLATLLALTKLGAIINPYPPQVREHELSQMGSFVAIKALVTIDLFRDRNLLELTLNAKQNIPSLKKIFCFGNAVQDTVTISLKQELNQQYSVAEMENYCKENPVNPNDTATICWTSGTTGVSKGVPRSHNLWGVYDCVVEGLDFDQNTIFLTPFPIINMAGIGGCFIPWISTGCKLVMHQPFELPIFLKQIMVEKVTYTIAPPAILNLLLKNEAILEQVDVSSLKTIGSGSAPLSFWMIKSWKEKYGIDVTNFFGSNEGIALVGTPITIPDMEKRAQFFPAFGYDKTHFNHISIQQEMESKLVDMQTGAVIDTENVPGELYVKGPTVFHGYYKSPEANQQVFDAEGYFKTGDVFQLVKDDTGTFYYEFVDRCKDIIIRGGYNIAPAEIENLLQDFEPLQECAIIGYPDEIMGERVALFAVLKAEQTATLDQIINHLKGKKIASYKIPEKLILVEAIPRNPIGKILRLQLRNQL